MDSRAGGAIVEVTNTAGTYSVTGLLDGGSGYMAGDTITVLGMALGGASPENDLVLTVANDVAANGRLTPTELDITSSVRRGARIGIVTGITHN